MDRVKLMEKEEREEMIDFYKELVELVGLDTYKTTKEIKNITGMNGRLWRTHVENIMHLYMYDLLDKMVVGNRHGYIYTDDKELIDRFLKAKEHQFKSLAYNCYNLRKSLNRKDNLTFDEYLKECL